MNKFRRLFSNQRTARRAASGQWLVLQAVAMLLLLLGSGCGHAQSKAPLPNDVPWYNVSQPLTWSDLKGRVVLLDFFTPGCINCVHMLPVEDKLASRFGKQLVIIGIDAPKFTNSSTQQGLKDFITQFDIRHPIFLDADMSYWRAWNVHAWPTLILIGPDGKTIGRLLGEQSFPKLAIHIRAALAGAPPVSKLAPLPLTPMPMGGDMLEAPGGIASNDDFVAISDTGNNRIVIANHAGKVKAVIGGCGAAPTFNRPHGLDFHAGKLYVANTRGQLIQVVDVQTGQVTTLAGSGERAFVVRGQYKPLEATLNSPWAVQWAQGKLYISMAGDHQIWRFDPQTNRVGPWAGSGREGLQDGNRKSARFAQSSGLDAHAGQLYVADPESSAIRRIDISNGQVHTLIGQGLFKFGFVDGAARKALLQHAEDVIWLDGSLYIADTFNNAIRRLDLATNSVSTVAKGLDQPQALAALDAHTLLVAEAGGNRIVQVALPDGQVKPWPLDGLGKHGCTALAAE